jgi:hypothetical protein
MWLFLATEVLFFGALFLTWIYSRHWNQAGFDAGARQTELAIGTINTVILLASSFVFSAGLAFIEVAIPAGSSSAAPQPGHSASPSSFSSSASTGATISPSTCFLDPASHSRAH